MIFALWSILLVALLPLAWALVAKAGAPYDNNRPREVLAAASGYRQRANWAQQNAWEAFPTYAAAMLLAWQMKVPDARLDLAALVFILLRVCHGLCYLADQAGLRSLSWLGGYLVVVALFLMAGGVV
ncbi:MAPEG family protein [uncultured Aquitalea sp.]|uniref:MAPEG family protein n=1 Tax=uncultured Aquitalea sp. TaxID=540272 RepID=UPI0025DF1CCC|nr:MAPEG family protein [uncultured Aquitalea sp.]